MADYLKLARTLHPPRSLKVLHDMASLSNYIFLLHIADIQSLVIILIQTSVRLEVSSHIQFKKMIS